MFADPDTVVADELEDDAVEDRNRTARPSDRLTRGTTFTDMMDQADLGDVHRGKKSYVPGATPRI